MKAELVKNLGLRSLAYYAADVDLCCLNVLGEFTPGETQSNSPCSHVIHLDSQGRLRSLEVLDVSTASEMIPPLPVDVEHKVGDIKLMFLDNFESISPRIHFSEEDRRLTLVYSSEPSEECIHLGDSFIAGLSRKGEVLRLDLLNILSAAQYRQISKALNQ
jgi:hypothetical protein